MIAFSHSMPLPTSLRPSRRRRLLTLREYLAMARRATTQLQSNVASGCRETKKRLTCQRPGCFAGIP